MTYHFGPFVLDVQEHRLLRDGAPLSLSPKVFDTLAYLVARAGHLVSKDELLETVWGGSIVEEGSVARTIHILRKTLTAGDDETQASPQYIETVPTRGYRFVAAVTRLDTPSESLAGPNLETTAGITTRQAAPARRAKSAALALLACVALAIAAWSVLDRPGLSALSAGPSPRHTVSGAAYVRFESGRLHLDRHLPGDIEAALTDFEAAIHLDPSYAAAYAGEGDARFFRYWDTEAHDDIVKARLAINKAIALDGDSSYGHALLCRLLGTYDWDLAAAQVECRRAVELDPRNVEARRESAFLMNVLGRRDAALKEMDAAIALAPTSFNKRSRGMLLYFSRRFDEAAAQLMQVEASDPEYVESSRWIARCFEQTHDYDRALAFLIRFRESDGATSDELGSLRQAYAAGGWPGVLRASLPPGRPQATLDAAGSLAQLGDIDEAFGVLEAMISARRVMILHMDSDPRLDPLRFDPRFETLAKRVGLR
jgi:DNA-binding winged helix-turn-helix (wHTH) protein/tetratricopeptide (TPR) repeat protein